MTLLRDEISPVKSQLTDTASGTAFHLYEYINKANESVIIDSPYLILTKELESLLRSVIARGVKVRILTNSLKATDGILPQAAYIGQRKKMVRMGIELYEYFGEDSFHSKSLVIDNKIAIIGSYNFDPRSQNLNTETMSVFYDLELAQALTDSMNKSLLLSYSVDQNGRPVGHEKKYPGVKLSKVILTKLIQFLVVPYAKGLL
jgi:putative cardiolipin synthase